MVMIWLSYSLPSEHVGNDFHLFLADEAVDCYSGDAQTGPEQGALGTEVCLCLRVCVFL